MPALNILTNLPKAKIPKDFVDKIIPTLSKVVNKPEQKFICVVSGDALLHMHGDSSSPGAVARLESIGNLGPEQNQVISRHLADFVEKELGISPNRFFLTFYDLEKYNVSTKGTTVAQLE
ncbi:hypothetical protein O0L34_g4162 [Tuta absoluta]|nr:hypothetical protein O0L34_g4162 [Tuta absoluta]